MRLLLLLGLLSVRWVLAADLQVEMRPCSSSRPLKTLGQVTHNIFLDQQGNHVHTGGLIEIDSLPRQLVAYHPIVLIIVETVVVLSELMRAKDW